MTYSYTTPGDSEKDTLRFLIQDTDPFDAAEWQVTDEEIQYTYDIWFPLYNSMYYVAAALCETIAARYAREASYSADGVSISLGPVGDQYRALAASLRAQDKAVHVGALVDVGGIAPNEPLQPGTKPFSFGKGLHDFVEAGPQEFGGVYPPDQDTGSVGIPDYEKVVEPVSTEVHSPITAHARNYVRARATEVMEYTCEIYRGSRPEAYDEDTLVFTVAGPKDLVYAGVCRIWELSSASSIVVGDADVYQQATNLSIPWDEPAIIRRYDEVIITSAPQDSQMVGERFEIQTIAKAGELRATRRFEITGVM